MGAGRLDGVRINPDGEAVKIWHLVLHLARVGVYFIGVLGIEFARNKWVPHEQFPWVALPALFLLELILLLSLFDEVIKAMTKAAVAVQGFISAFKALKATRTAIDKPKGTDLSTEPEPEPGEKR